MKMLKIEDASRQAWPALEEKELPFGVLRYACGVNRRSNSMNVYPRADYEYNDLLRSTESFFGQRSLPASVRILGSRENRELDFQLLDSYLAGKGYGLEAPTNVLLCDLPISDSTNAYVAESLELNDWLRAWQTIGSRSNIQVGVHQITLSKIIANHCFLTLKDKLGITVSCAMGVISDDVLGIYGVGTRETYRGLGYGTSLLERLMRWGSSNRARYACLQVESANFAALRLYEKLGFRKFYSYWYRVQNQHCMHAQGVAHEYTGT
ncbi:MAG: GNAT family N-acetyltransferase [Pseudohongiellaceae bacterium]